MTVLYEEEVESTFEFDVEQQLNRVILYVRDYIKCPYDVEVSVTLVSKETIQQINQEFREIDRSTDVLSFPMMEYDSPADFAGEAFQMSKSISPDTSELILGDIVLCADVVREQAKEYGHSELRELSFLTVHSMLHLFGYDHMEDEERMEMEEEQRKIMSGLGIERD